MEIHGKVDVECIQIQLQKREIQASFSASCKGRYIHEDAEPYDSNGTGYPGWNEVDLESVAVDEWEFFDNDGNEVELTDSEMRIAEKQIIESVKNEDSEITWEYQ